MRLQGRGVAVGLAALVCGFAVSWIAAVWLRSATPDAGLLWREADARHVASWTLVGAHGVPLQLEAKAGLTGDVGSRIGDLFGRQLPKLGGEAGATATVRLAPLTVLLVTGLVLALGLRTAEARDPGEAVVAALFAGGAYGVGLAAIAGVSAANVGFKGRLVEAGVDAHMSLGLALIAGFVLGTVFALLGVVSKLPQIWRVLGAGLRRAALAGSVAALVGIVLLAIAHRGSGSGPFGHNGKLDALGVALLAPNLIGAGAVLAHGAALHASFTAGPLAKVTSLGYGSTSIGPARWLMVLVPLLAGVAAGRAMRRRADGLSIPTLAIGFGVLWGVVLGVLSVLLHVELLSSFSLTSLGSSGAATINPVLALVLGVVWATVTSYAGMVTVRASQPLPMPPAASERRCASCGAVVPPADNFCGVCGARV